MNQSNEIYVYSQDQVRGVVVTNDSSVPSDATHTLVQFTHGQRFLIPNELLVWQADGSYFVPLNVAQGQSQDQTTSAERQASTVEHGQTHTLVLPVIVEEAQISKRQVASGGVRVRKIVHEHEEIIDEPLLREEVVVERVPKNTIVEHVDHVEPVRYEGDTMIVAVLEEVFVVEKRLMLKEELHITRRQTTVHEPQTVKLRSEEVVVEPIDPAGSLERSTT